jgi:hypothetical protein
MMGRLDREQGHLFYCFNLEEVVREDSSGSAYRGRSGPVVGPHRVGAALLADWPAFD